MMDATQTMVHDHATQLISSGQPWQIWLGVAISLLTLIFIPLFKKLLSIHKEQDALATENRTLKRDMEMREMDRKFSDKYASLEKKVDDIFLSICHKVDESETTIKHELKEVKSEMLAKMQADGIQRNMQYERMIDLIGHIKENVKLGQKPNKQLNGGE